MEAEEGGGAGAGDGGSWRGELAEVELGMAGKPEKRKFAGTGLKGGNRENGVDGVVEIGARGGDDRWEGGVAIKQRRRLRRPEVAATAAAAGRLH